MVFPALDIFLADCANRVGHKPKVFVRSRGEINEIKRGEPLLANTKAKLLRLVAIVPDVVYCAGLFFEFTIKVFDSVAVDNYHPVILSIFQPPAVIGRD